jgi:hypothetical protein
MLREGIPTVRFTTKECHEKTADVVVEFLGRGLVSKSNISGLRKQTPTLIVDNYTLSIIYCSFKKRAH